MNFQPNNGICIPKTKENQRKTIKRKPTAPPGPRPGQARAGARVLGPNWGGCRLAFHFCSKVFLCFGYAYAIIGLEIQIRLDSISNVCIIIPGKTNNKSISQMRRQHRAGFSVTRNAVIVSFSLFSCVAGTSKQTMMEPVKKRRRKL